MNQITTHWNLRTLLADQGIFKTTELVPLLAERDVRLSREQMYRLVTAQPARLNMEVLGALCDILHCTPSDLITVTVTATVRSAVSESRPGRGVGSLRPIPATVQRPRT